MARLSLHRQFEHREGSVKLLFVGSPGHGGCSFQGADTGSSLWHVVGSSVLTIWSRLGGGQGV